MKTTLIILLQIVLLQIAGADPVTIEEFRKMDIPSRRQAILEAPPEQKAELKRIHRHLLLVSELGDEKALEAMKESMMVHDRGLGGLVQPFVAQQVLRDAYIGEFVKENLENKSLTDSEREAKERAARKEYDSIALRGILVASLVFHVAVSPKAIELAKEGEAMKAQYLDEIEVPKGKLSKSELSDFDRKADEFFEKIKTLPKIPEEQLRAQSEAFDEATIPFGK
jgi:hypothetical protein